MGTQISEGMTKQFETGQYEGTAGPRLLGLSGYAGTGKDTVANRLVEKFGWTKVAFADELKAVLLKIDPWIQTFDSPLSTVVQRRGWDIAKQYKDVRQLLQNVGQVLRDHFGEDIWLKVMAQRLEVLLPNTRVVVSDVRYENEAKLVKRYGGLLYRINRQGYNGINDHPSERSLQHYTFDDTLYNNGPLDVLHTVVDSTHRKLTP